MKTIPLRPADRSIIAGLAMMLAVVACGPRRPTGQVLATVNGQEVTTRDLQAELVATGVAPNPEADKRALDVIVTRRLVAGEGRRLGLDRSPDYLALVQRGSEALLGSQTIAGWAQDLPAPAPAAIQAYITAHPLGFADRRSVDLEQIVTGPADLPPATLQSLKTMAEVEATLRARGIALDHRRSTVDTVVAPDAVSRQLLTDHGAEPIVERVGDHLVFSAVAAVRPTPLPQPLWRKVATERLKEAAVQQRLTTLRKTAKISYQAGSPAG